VWCLMKNLFQVFVEGEERYWTVCFSRYCRWGENCPGEALVAFSQTGYFSWFANPLLFCDFLPSCDFSPCSYISFSFDGVMLSRPIEVITAFSSQSAFSLRTKLLLIVCVLLGVYWWVARWKRPLCSLAAVVWSLQIVTSV
jgi:hypothetical protein